MAILSGGLLGRSRNVVGGIVTYVRDGQNVARSKADKPRNPRTAAQMNQRTKLANVVAMYRANATWMDKYAFENRPQTWSVYNAFVSANLTANRVALTKEQSAAGACIVAPYLMTKGSIPSIEVTPTSANWWQTNLAVGSDFAIDATTTIGALSSALIVNNNGLVRGMQLSLILNYQRQTANVYYNTPRWYEVIINPDNNDLLSTRMDIEHMGVSNGNISFVRGQSDPVMGFLYCLSHTTDRTRVSTQRLILTSTDVYDIFTSDAAVAAAIESYGSTDTYPFLESSYGSASDASVVIGTSILSAVIGDGTFVPVGDYLGSVGTEMQFTVNVRLSQRPSNTPLSMTIVTTDTSSNSLTTTDLFVQNDVCTANFPAGQINPSSPVIRINLTMADGTIQEAEFSRYEPDDHGDVTE